MPKGTPVAAGGDAVIGRIPGTVPAVPFAYRNYQRVAGQTGYDILNAAPFTFSNASSVATPLDYSPTGFTQGYLITDTSAPAVGFIFVESLGGGLPAGPGMQTCGQIFMRLNAASTAIFRFQYEIGAGGGAFPDVGSVDINVATGAQVAAVQPGNGTITVTVAPVADGQTWLQISIAINDQRPAAGGTTGRITMFPDVSAGGTGSVVVLQPGIYGPQGGLAPVPAAPPGALTNPLPWPIYAEAANVQAVWEGKIPRTVLDTRWQRVTIGNSPLTIDPDVYHATIINPNGNNQNIALPRLNFRSNVFSSSMEGVWFILDIADAMSSATNRNLISASGGSPGVFFHGIGSVALSAVPVNLCGNQVVGGVDCNFADRNVSAWLFVGGDPTTADWIAYPIAESHGRQIFDANANFRWPLGARTVWLTGAGGGGGGASNGGGGGGGDAVNRLPFVPTGTWGGTNRAVTVGAGGAGGAGGAAGAAGGATTFNGASVTLNGGNGGQPIGGGGTGGAAGGAGGMNGQGVIVDAGSNILIGGSGGPNIAGGIGGEQIASAVLAAGSAGSAGLQGGGGAGSNGGAAAGGTGGAGFLMIEW